MIGPITCNSGWKSPSIGSSGACSSHGGVAEWKAFLPIILAGGVAFWFYGKFSPRRLPQNKDQNDSPRPIEPIETPKPAPKSSRPRSVKSQPNCPRCRAKMVLRTASQGRNAGGQFWGCPKYPRCRGTRRYVSENKA
nr:topoisomerase DNA-binding C4 zinc finger domain-containing protein [Marinobacter halodurans]